jgi:prepilin-type N-terminal cleavage/methylation domain-containing protein
LGLNKLGGEKVKLETNRLLRQGKVQNGAGFSLIELLVAIAIISILASIAVFGFISLRQRAYNASAQSVSVGFSKTEGVYFSENSVYTTNVSALISLDKNLLDDPEVTFVFLGANTSGYTINFRHSNGDRWFTASQQ